MTHGKEPAYPVEISIGENGEIMGCRTSNNTGFSIGLSKREMFSAIAMQGIMASSQGWPDGNPQHMEEAARRAVNAADALIKQLNSTDK